MVLSNRKRSSTSLPSTCRVFCRNLMAIDIFLCIQILRVFFLFSCLLAIFMSPPPQKKKKQTPPKKRVVRLTCLPFDRSRVGHDFRHIRTDDEQGMKKITEKQGYIEVPWNHSQFRWARIPKSSGMKKSAPSSGRWWFTSTLNPRGPGFPPTLAGIQRCILAPKYSTLSPASKRVGLGGQRKMWKKTCK